LRDPNGETLRYTILGPWEVGSASGVLSYLSDDAAPLMGREAGSRVEITIGGAPVECEIVAIERAAEIG
jgi:transcription elongation GreA/GreB family factor